MDPAIRDGRAVSCRLGIRPERGPGADAGADAERRREVMPALGRPDGRGGRSAVGRVEIVAWEVARREPSVGAR
ncbi:hypothetical protein ACFRCI_46820 [Streptomyces sp. NPDC056638]|uniref:hypothetical protein n=1 Tax=Streptomyces sp. NPDC056638 TaxID=3345887 RepID=UPI0036916882